MAQDQPSNSGGGSTVGHGMPGYPFPLASHPRAWPAMAVGVVGVLLGAAALVVALTRSTPEPVAAKALAGIATTNGALMLETVASNPALDANHRDAAQALESAYLAVRATSRFGVATDSDFQAALDNILAKDAAMEKVCGGG